MLQPTLADYGRRLGRVLAGALDAAGRARAQLAAEGAGRGEFHNTSSGFRLREEDLARSHFVSGMELALGELRRVMGQTQLDAAELRDVTGEAIQAHLDRLIMIAYPRGDGAFDTTRGVSDVYGRLRELMDEVLYEFDRGLYVLPGDPAAPVTINVANLHGSQVGTIQQSGGNSRQRQADND